MYSSLLLALSRLETQDIGVMSSCMHYILRDINATVSTCASSSRKLFSPRESGVIGVYPLATPGISSQKKRTGHLKVTLATTRSLRGFLSGRMCTSLTASWMRSKRVCSSAPSNSSGMRSSSSRSLRYPSMRFSAVVILAFVSSNASLNPASRSYRSSRRLCRSLNLRS